MKKILILSSIGAILICLVGITYYLAIHLPSKQRAELYFMQAKTELEKEKLQIEEKQNRQEKLDECLHEVSKSLSEFWGSECKSQGLKEDCRLPEYNADRIDKLRKERRSECFSRYN